jgi:hypothetical protein
LVYEALIRRIVMTKIIKWFKENRYDLKYTKTEKVIRLVAMMALVIAAVGLTINNESMNNDYKNMFLFMALGYFALLAAEWNYEAVLRRRIRELGGDKRHNIKENSNA